MGEFPKEWTWEENKLFEVALAMVDEQDPDRWEAVAAIVGGKKSAEEVQRHYVILLEDLHFIESGCLDHELEVAQSYGQVECISQSVYWTDEDQKLFIQLDIN
ncbi:SANT domain-containing protein [Psidium guajava]|nr:SANT domain-containing protein [Psidium guajava]